LPLRQGKPVYLIILEWRSLFVRSTRQVALADWLLTTLRGRLKQDLLLTMGVTASWSRGLPGFLPFDNFNYGAILKLIFVVASEQQCISVGVVSHE
jgi:hypothetical protein